MKKIIILTIIVCDAFCIAQTLTIGTNTLGVSFVYTSLSSIQKDQILADLKICVNNPWGDEVEIDRYNENEFVGCLSPRIKGVIYPKNIEFPRNLITNNLGELSLQIPQKLSDSYTNAFVFVNSNSNIVSSAYEFVSFITYSNMVANVSSNSIINYIYEEGAPSGMYEMEFNEILKYYFQPVQYHPQSILGLFYDGVSTNAYNIKMNILCSQQITSYFEYSQMEIIWHNNRWKLHVK